MNKYPLKKSIKKRVIFQVSTLITVAMLVIMGVVSVLVYQYMHKQMETLLQKDAQVVQLSIEQRLRYLVENSQLLTKNEFVINALIDVDSRQSYLPPLVENFIDGKDVLSLSVVDFDGEALFKTQENIPQYKSSKELRASLALGMEVIYLDPQTSNIVLIAPIQYYATTQGAIVVLFDSNKIFERSFSNVQSSYMRIYRGEQALFTYGHDAKQSYSHYMLPALQETPIIAKLQLDLELGVQSELFLAPVKSALARLFITGLLFILVGIFASVVLAKTITQPILTLYNRIKASDASEELLCAPLGTDDELEALADVFDQHTHLLQYQATHDYLTSLPNRVLFIDRLEQALENAKKDHTMVAILFIDLDRFKAVNDSFGHTVGDTLLKNIASLLQKRVREIDTVARFGGDEFAILAKNIRSENSIVDLMINIMDDFKEVQAIDEHQFYISCSIGVAIYPHNANSAEEMVQNADAAMYKAKEEGRNTYAFYTEDMTQRAYDRVTLETHLREAILKEEFEVYFQPQIDMRDQKLVGMEALVRWIKEGETIATPDQFIPLAEDTRLIVELDRFVMRSAIEAFAQWIQKGYEPGVLSLNMSIVHLEHGDFIDTLKTMLKKSGLSIDRVELEVTETQIMRDPNKTIELLKEIKDLGFSIAVDDFGTGHSSLSYLKKLPINRLKIDQSFVREIPHDKDDVALTRTIIAMALNLNLEIIAEGVEKKEQAKFLIEHGCNDAQGYLYHKPMPSKEILKLLQG